MSARKRLLCAAIVACIALMLSSAKASAPPSIAQASVTPGPAIASPIASASPVATATPTRIPYLPGFEPSDAIDEILIGVWQCQTFGGTALTHEYSRSDDLSSLLVDTRVGLADHPAAALHETYQHHLGSNTWTAILENGAFIATAADPSGDTWTFTGQLTEGQKKSKVRMIYTLLGSDTFRRDFQRGDGVWSTYSGETCRRLS